MLLAGVLDMYVWGEGTRIAVNQGDEDIWVPTGLRVLHHTALLSHRNKPDGLLLVDFLNFCLFEAGSF